MRCNAGKVSVHPAATFWTACQMVEYLGGTAGAERLISVFEAVIATIPGSSHQPWEYPFKCRECFPSPKPKNASCMNPIPAFLT